MTSVQVKEKIQMIESELEMLKYAVAQEPDFAVDEKNWDDVRADLKKIRKDVFVRTYGRKK